MEMMQITLGTRAVSNPQCSNWFLFTSDSSKHCISFISTSRSKQRTKMLFCDCGISGSPFHFFPSSFCEISGADAHRYLGLWISWRWLKINLHNPPWSFLSPSFSFSPVLVFFYLLHSAERTHPERASWMFKKRA